jgi:xanthine/CO dehydrogenase XdhC/CoxF family maturation factor
MSLQSLNENRRDQSEPRLPYSNNALRCDLRRVHDAWRESRRQHNRFSVYQYLGTVFDLVMVWEKENRATDRAKRALQLKGRKGGDEVEPFAAVINCASSRKKVDAKARSKWARALMFAAEYKLPSEPLEHFVRRRGGINACAAKLSRLSRTQPRTR